MKTLVLYFSASNRTASLAGELADFVKGELLEIRPKVPYTQKDLHWINPLARCNREKLSREEVPAEEIPVSLEDYDLVFLGFPIWYGGAPEVVYTFVKSLDWKGKTVAPFATSGGGGVGKTKAKLEAIMPGARILEPRLLKAGDGTVM